MTAEGFMRALQKKLKTYDCYIKKLHTFIKQLRFNLLMLNQKHKSNLLVTLT